MGNSLEEVQRVSLRVSLPTLAIKWAFVLSAGLAVYLAPVPQGISAQGWRLFAIFIAMIAGTIARPLPTGGVVLLGIVCVAITKSMPLSDAMIRTVTNPAMPDLKAVETLRIKATLAGYSDPVVWLVLAAFLMSRGMVKTGLGRRIALLFIKFIGRRSLGLGYALVGADLVLASAIPSNGARCGGILFPISKSIAEAYDSTPGETARRLGAFLMCFMYQCDAIVCAMFLTGQASNPVIQKFAKLHTGIDLNYTTWMTGAILPGAVSLLVTGFMLYRLFPPTITQTPGASDFAKNELEKMGPMSWQEKLMLSVFLMVGLLWASANRLHTLDYTVIALIGICLLVLGGVLTWEDALAERAGWDVFVWYGGLVRMAEALGETGITKRFAETSAGFTTGWKWWMALALLALVYFYAHYGFASTTAHVLAMCTRFMIVVVAAGAPPILAVALLAFFSNLAAGLTHYGTTTGPIYFGTGYVTQQKWWQLGLFASITNILIWTAVGLVWWKLLGWW